MEIAKVLERKKVFFFLVYVSMVLAIILLPTMSARATSIGTNVTVTGTTNLNGNTTIGDSATADTLTVTARLAADLDPNANNTIDLGAFDLAYNNIYVSSTAFMNYVSSTMISISGLLSPITNNDSDLGVFGTAWNDVFSSGTAWIATLTVDGNTTLGNSATADTITVTARLAADLDPNANGTIDLGAFGLAYDNITASGTAYLGSVTSTQITPWANNTSDLGGYGVAWRDLFVSGTLYTATLNQWDTNLTLGGNFTAGNATTSDIVYLNSRIASSMIPTVNNSEDVGEFSRAWNNVFVSSTAYMGSVTSTQITPWANNTSDFGGYGAAWRNVFVSSTAYMGSVTSTQIAPWANNTSDFGGYGAAWRNIYASSTSYLDGITTTMISPWANNTSALGAFGNAWTNVFSSGTAWIGTLTVDGNTTLGNDATADTLTVTARLAADLDPNANNTIDIGAYGLAFNDVFASGTMYAATSSLVNTTGTSTLYVSSTAAGYGSRIIMSRTNGTGCVSLYFNTIGNLTTSSVDCLPAF